MHLWAKGLGREASASWTAGAYWMGAIDGYADVDKRRAAETLQAFGRLARERPEAGVAMCDGVVYLTER